MILGMINLTVASLTKALVENLLKVTNSLLRTVRMSEVYSLAKIWRKWSLTTLNDTNECVWRALTLIISSLVFRVAVRDSILAVCPSLRPSSSDSKDWSSASEIWNQKIKMHGTVTDKAFREE